MSTGHELLGHLLARYAAIRGELPWLSPDQALSSALWDASYTEEQIGDTIAALETLANPRPGMSAQLQAHRFRLAQRRAARALRWRQVSGGRASHAFTEDAEVPLCGVRPVSSTGVERLWIPVSGRTMHRRHRECQRRMEKLVNEGALRPGLMFG